MGYRYRSYNDVEITLNCEIASRISYRIVKKKREKVTLIGQERIAEHRKGYSSYRASLTINISIVLSKTSTALERRVTACLYIT